MKKIRKKETQDIVEAMHQDFLSGMPKHLMRKKFINDMYCDFSSTSIGTKNNKFNKLWDLMVEMFAEDFEENREALKTKFLARYGYLYSQAVEKGNIKEARQVLDSLKELTLGKEPEKMDVNMQMDGELNINFDTDQ